MDRPVIYPVLRASPRFRSFWTARLISHTAQNALLLGLLVTVVTRTGSTIHSSLLVLTFVIPSALFGLVGGVATDRLPPRELLLTTSLCRTALCLLFLHGDGGVAAIYAANFGLSVLTQFASPAEATALPRVVQPGQLVTATAALNLESILAQLLGTVLLAPLLLRALGLAPLFSIAALAFFSATLLYARVAGLDRAPVEEAPHQRTARQDKASRVGIRAAASEIWRLVRADRIVLRSVIVQTMVTTTVVVLISIVPGYARSVLGLPPEDSVAVFAPAALGVFLGLHYVPHLARRHRGEGLVSAGLGLFILGLLALGLDRELSLLVAGHAPGSVLGVGAIRLLYTRPALASITAAPMGFAYSLVLVTARAMLYERVPVTVQGRVFAFQGVLANLASILPLILVGFVGYWLGPRAVFLLVAAANLGGVWWTAHLSAAGAAKPSGTQLSLEPVQSHPEG